MAKHLASNNLHIIKTLSSIFYGLWPDIISQMFQPFPTVQEPDDLQILVLHSFSKKACIIIYTQETPHIPFIGNYPAMKGGKQSGDPYEMSNYYPVPLQSGLTLD